MSFPFFAGTGSRRDEEVTLPKSKRVEYLKPQFYRADPGLVDAVNVALLLGQPLLLTGEPGTGKTSLGYYLAWELRVDHVLKFETKSTSSARDLFYTYDALTRFQHAQSGIKSDTSLPYITYNALGEAILYSRSPDDADVASKMPPGFEHPGEPSRSVVIIDEIDKAPRDFPNDILNELDQLYFRVPELDNEEIRVNDDLRPIVLITSNSEKDLPDAFLRRCVFYHIPFPKMGQLEHIVTNRLGTFAAGHSELLNDALNFFYLLREPGSDLRKKPATAELLDWLGALGETSNGNGKSLRADPNRVLSTIGLLAKTVDDQRKAEQIARRWIEERM